MNHLIVLVVTLAATILVQGDDAVSCYTDCSAITEFTVNNASALADIDDSQKKCYGDATPCPSGESCYSVELTILMIGTKDGDEDDIEMTTTGFYCAVNATSLTELECEVIEALVETTLANEDELGYTYSNITAECGTSEECDDECKTTYSGSMGAVRPTLTAIVFLLIASLLNLA